MIPNNAYLKRFCIFTPVVKRESRWRQGRIRVLSGGSGCYRGGQGVVGGSQGVVGGVRVLLGVQSVFSSTFKAITGSTQHTRQDASE